MLPLGPVKVVPDQECWTPGRQRCAMGETVGNINDEICSPKSSTYEWSAHILSECAASIDDLVVARSNRSSSDETHFMSEPLQ